jgi:hypothetical protein
MRNKGRVLLLLLEVRQSGAVFVVFMTGLVSHFIACSEPLGFSGNGTAGKYTSKGVTIKEAGTIIAAHGHMHVSGISHPFQRFQANLFSRTVKTA